MNSRLTVRLLSNSGHPYAQEKEIVMRGSFRSTLFVLLVAALVLSACGGSGGEEPAPAKAPAESDATQAPSVSLGGKSLPGAVSSVEGVKSATIQILAEGTLLEPGGAQPNANWSGTGFFIDPSGIAVTNNHVVTGAARMKVLVGGEDEPRNARVLGVAECSDLAVIDVDGDGFPFLAWHDGPVDVGLDVYAAGFPLGDPEYTLTRGIVSKARADGDRTWTSVDYVLEHDANIQPGNSGGPLVDNEGQVAGVNYSGGFAALASQFYAIAPDEALPVIERLREGEDVNSFGLNGEAFVDEESGFSGIWVTSVTSGSVMDNVGVRPGDIISSMEGISLGRGGTMAEYCDILKSHSPDDVLALEVIRFATGELLAGRLNGDELETTTVFDPSVPSPDDPAQPTSGDYIDTSDAYGAIALELPASWADTDGSAWVDGNDVIGASISAAPDLESYNRTWGAPGLFFGVSDDLALLGGHVQILDAVRPDYLGDCKLEGRYDYNDGYYRGKYDLFESCGGPGGASTLVLSAVPTDNSQAFTILLIVQMVNPEDEDIAIHALDTFRVIGRLP
jgi:serine protease Do